MYKRVTCELLGCFRAAKQVESFSFRPVSVCAAITLFSFLVPFFRAAAFLTACFVFLEFFWSIHGLSRLHASQ